MAKAVTIREVSLCLIRRRKTYETRLLSRDEENEMKKNEGRRHNAE